MSCRWVSLWKRRDGDRWETVGLYAKGNRFCSESRRDKSNGQIGSDTKSITVSFLPLVHRIVALVCFPQQVKDDRDRQGPLIESASHHCS